MFIRNHVPLVVDRFAGTSNQRIMRCSCIHKKKGSSKLVRVSQWGSTCIFSGRNESAPITDRIRPESDPHLCAVLCSPLHGWKEYLSIAHDRGNSALLLVLRWSKWLTILNLDQMYVNCSYLYVTCMSFDFYQGLKKGAAMPSFCLLSCGHACAFLHHWWDGRSLIHLSCKESRVRSDALHWLWLWCPGSQENMRLFHCMICFPYSSFLPFARWRFRCSQGRDV
jgi:hypothetical protein